MSDLVPIVTDLLNNPILASLVAQLIMEAAKATPKKLLSKLKREPFTLESIKELKQQLSLSERVGDALATAVKNANISDDSKEKLFQLDFLKEDLTEYFLTGDMQQKVQEIISDDLRHELELQNVSEEDIPKVLSAYLVAILDCISSDTLLAHLDLKADNKRMEAKIDGVREDITQGFKHFAGTSAQPLTEEKIKWALIKQYDLRPSDIQEVSPELKALLIIGPDGRVKLEAKKTDIYKILIKGREVPLHVRPLIAQDFVPRVALINQIRTHLDQYKIGFLYGYPKVGKSSVVSQFIDAEYNDESYFWYSFSAEQEDTPLFWKHLAQFMAQAFQKYALFVKFDEGKLRRRELLDVLIECLSSSEPILFVLDNFEVLKNTKFLDEFLNRLASANIGQSQVVIISARKGTPFAVTQVLGLGCELKIPGFNVEEMAKFCQVSRLPVTKVLRKVLKILHTTTEGHPLMLRLLLPDLQRVAYEGDIEVLSKQIPNIKSAEPFFAELRSRVYSALPAEEDKALLNRLSALSYPFTCELAEELCSVTPIIPNPGMHWNNVKSSVLEQIDSERFSVPKLFRKIGQMNLTDNERKELCHTAAHFLVTPKVNNTVNARDADQAIFYFYVSGDLQRAVYHANLLLTAASLDNQQSFCETLIDFWDSIFTNALKSNKMGFCTWVYTKAVVFARFKKHKKVRDCIDVLDSEIKDISPNDKNFTQLLVLVYATKTTAYALLKQYKKLCKFALAGFEDTHLKELAEARLLLGQTAISTMVLARISTLKPLKRVLEDIEPETVLAKRLFTPEVLEAIDLGMLLGNKRAFENRENEHVKRSVISQVEKIYELAEHKKLKVIKFVAAKWLGLLYLDLNYDTSGAISILKKNEHLAEDITETDIVAGYFGNYGDALRSDGQFSGAAKSYEFALTSFKDEFYNFPLIGHTLFNLGKCQAWLENWNESEGNYKRAHRYFLSDIKHRGTWIRFPAEALGELAIVYIKTNNLNQALKTLIRIAKDFERYSSQEIIHLVGYLAGYIQLQIRRRDKKNLKRAQRLSNQFPEPVVGMVSTFSPQYDATARRPTISTAYYAIAECYSVLGELGLANGLYRRSLEAAYSESGSLVYALAYPSLIEGLTKTEQYVKAVETIFEFVDFVNSEKCAQPFLKQNREGYITAKIAPEIVNRIYAAHKNERLRAEAEASLSVFISKSKVSKSFQPWFWKSYSLSVAGWYHYFYGDRERGLGFIQESEEIAEKHNVFYVRWNNAMFREFEVPKSIGIEIRDHVIDHITTISLILENVEEGFHYRDTYGKKFVDFWTGLTIKDRTKLDEEEIAAYNAIVNIGQKTKKSDQEPLFFTAACLAVVLASRHLRLTENRNIIHEFLLKADLSFFDETEIAELICDYSDWSLKDVEKAALQGQIGKCDLLLEGLESNLRKIEGKYSVEANDLVSDAVKNIRYRMKAFKGI